MPQRDSTYTGIAAVSLLTLLAFAIAGYHPFVEDGGVYAAGIEKLLNPALFPTWTAFVTEHLRFSLFAPIVATIVRVTHASLESTLFVLYFFSIWATLYAAWLLTCRLTLNTHARIAGVSLLACWLTLPIAGTSLMLMDPYVTARSFTTPLTLLAVTWTLDALSGCRLAWLFCGVSLCLAALLHPLMAGYALAFVLSLVAIRTGKYWPRVIFVVAAVTTGAILQKLAAPESPTYVRIAITRYYWFLSQWHWYELLGLVAPILILVPVSARKQSAAATRTVAQSAILLGATAVLVALLFAQEAHSTHLVARLQPLRAFQIVYELMILLLGSWLGIHLLRRSVWRWAIFIALLGMPMYYAQRGTFANSAHIEWPTARPKNPWQQAFVWIRMNTPVNALFALDAHYITEGRHEDAQCFRAIAERSALPDYSKDGGEASITPALTKDWAIGQAAQTGLELQPDALRETTLRPLGVTWAVLASTSQTAWFCPYNNQTVKVCRLP